MKSPRSWTEPPPILFVHGMWHGDWCWENFRGYFTRLGIRCEALDLPEHGRKYRSAWRLKGLSLRRCADAVREEIGRYPETPILVGHSLGCLLVEAVLARLGESRGAHGRLAGLRRGIPPGRLNPNLRPFRLRPSAPAGRAGSAA